MRSRSVAGRMPGVRPVFGHDAGGWQRARAPLTDSAAAREADRRWEMQKRADLACTAF